jgi:hypothetical protein
MTRPDQNEPPAVGAPLVDLAHSAIGEFQEEVSGRYFLRPIGGGREWDIDPKWTRPATEADLKAGHLHREVVSWSQKAPKS